MAFCGTKKFRCDNDMSMFLHDMSVKLEKTESEVIRIIIFNISGNKTLLRSVFIQAYHAIRLL